MTVFMTDSFVIYVWRLLTSLVKEKYE